MLGSTETIPEEAKIDSSRRKRVRLIVDAYLAALEEAVPDVCAAVEERPFRAAWRIN
jgi:hypothetical protein